ncbi:MAG: YdeI/OmpD-associated family protein [Acidobacteria bacterium]|nr:YdeI/OmpD-associated family protein [Acidobacteriota bacterium]
MENTTHGPDEKPILSFDDIKAWRKWLDKNHASSSGVWLRLAKKGACTTSVTRNESLEAALCYGWIDGMAKSEGDETWLQKVTPRTKRSIWSKRNCEIVERLTDSGEMRPAGLAEIARARADGRWEAAYDGPKNMTVPEDLEKRLSRNKKAKAFFESLDSRNRFAILFRIYTAKKAETREKRIRKFVEMLIRQEKIYP